MSKKLPDTNSMRTGEEILISEFSGFLLSYSVLFLNMKLSDVKEKQIVSR